jgi:hypothetical protein
MMFLTRGATYPGLPLELAYPAAFGDLVTAIIAFVAIPLMLRGSFLAKPLVWYIFEFTASHNVQHYILKVILTPRSDRDDVMVRFLD